MDIGPTAAASKHTIAPINHTRPSSRKHSPDGATPSKVADIRLLLITHLSTSKEWKAELTSSGWFTHISGHSSAAGRPQVRESSPAKDRRYTTVPHNQHWFTGRPNSTLFSNRLLYRNVWSELTVYHLNFLFGFRRFPWTGQIGIGSICTMCLLIATLLRVTFYDEKIEKREQCLGNNAKVGV